MKIMISAIGSAGSQNIVKAFEGHNVRLIGLDCNTHNAGKYMVDEFHVIPKASDSLFLAELKSIITKLNPDLFIPAAPQELSVIADADLPCRVLISPKETIATCASKRKTLDFFREIGVPNESYFNAQNAQFPVFCKPDGGTGSADTRRVDSSAELQIILQHSQNMLVMPFIEGVECSVDCFCDKDGDLIGYVARKRLQTKGGVATKGITIKIPRLNSYLERITRGTPFIGPFNVQLFVKKDGSLSFFEINPRIGGAFIHSVRAGLDIAKYITDFVHERKSEKLATYEEGLIMMRRWEEQFENLS